MSPDKTKVIKSDNQIKTEAVMAKFVAPLQQLKTDQGSKTDNAVRIQQAAIDGLNQDASAQAGEKSGDKKDFSE